MEAIEIKSFGESYGIKNLKNELIAAVYLIKFKNRVTLLVSSSNNEGKEKSAMFLIIDHILQKYAGNHFIFDFEGGNVSGLAQFFSGFGAKSVNYFTLKQNKILWPFNRLL